MRISDWSSDVCSPIFVDDLEAVEIQVKQSHPMVCPGGMFDRRLHFDSQAFAVCQSGQRIVVGAVFQLTFLAAQFAHLSGNADAYAMLGQPPGRPLDGAAVTVLVEVAIEEMALQVAGHQLLGLLSGRGAIIGVNQIEYPPAQHLFRRVTEDALEARIDEQEASVDIAPAYSV